MVSPLRRTSLSSWCIRNTMAGCNCRCRMVPAQQQEEPNNCRLLEWIPGASASIGQNDKYRNGAVLKASHSLQSVGRGYIRKRIILFVHGTIRKLNQHMQNGTLWLRLCFWDTTSQNLIIIFHDIVYVWWYKFEQILRNIGALPKTIFYVSGQLLPQSFLQFLIDENQSLFSKVMEF